MSGFQELGVHGWGGGAVIIKGECEGILWGDGTTLYPDDYMDLYMC